MMLDRELRRGYRKAWVLTLLGVIYIVIYCGFAILTNHPGSEVQWDMRGAAFVPASAPEADGYHLPVTEPDWLEFGKEEGR